MTNREMVLFAAAMLFAATTLGLAYHTLSPWHGPGPRPMHAFMGKGGHHGAMGKKDWQAKKEQMFLKADTDQDGALTKEEMLAGFTARVEDMFTKLDKDGDAKLTREELEEGRKLMKQRLQKPDGEPQARRDNARIRG